MNCPHGVTGRCGACEILASGHQTTLGVAPLNCPHGLIPGVAYPRELCPLCKLEEAPVANEVNAKPSNCPHGGDPFPDGSPCMICALARNPPPNCPHKERIALGVDIRDGVDGKPVVVHKGMRCLACGDVKPVEVLLEEDRARAELGPMLKPETVRTAGEYIAQASPNLGPYVKPTTCPHGITLASAQPCFTCLASTLLEGKKARELVHTIAICTHADVHTVSHSLALEWCKACGAIRVVDTPWDVPRSADVAKALDAGAASSGPPPGGSPSDSSSKKSS